MEIELRARLTNGPRFLKSIQRNRLAVRIGSSFEDDRYLRHQSDTSRKLVLRIRRRGSSSTLTFKGRAKHADTAWPDVDLPLSHPDELEHLLQTSGYVHVVRIQKRRWSFRFNELELNIDQVRNLGWFVEIEARGAERQRAKLESKIEQTLVDFGINPTAIVRQGYVPLAIDREQGQ